jgi:DNA invertase Pin-like site-specific DNA recombinase
MPEEATMGRAAGHRASSERIALYMRVSSEEQAERMTIGTQEEFLEQYRDLYGHEVSGVYKDEAISGTVPMHQRTGGRALLEDAKESVFDVVLVYKLDRIGRTLLNVVDAHDRLDACGVALRSATEPIDTSSPSGRLIFHMVASFAEFGRGTIRERTQHGLHRAFRNGKQTGRIPYGYDVAEDGGFVIVEEEAAVVREIISNLAAGSTLYREMQRLNGLEVPGQAASALGALDRRHHQQARQPERLRRDARGADLGRRGQRGEGVPARGRGGAPAAGPLAARREQATGQAPG